MTTGMAVHAHGLARSLGLPVDRDPIESVVEWCEAAVARFHRDLPCETLAELLEVAANCVGTRIRVITSDEDLQAIITEYVDRGEIRFAALASDLAPDVFGQTLRLLHRRKGELPFVSLVDARGAKAFRQYFTAWHEVAHLLALPDNAARDSFQRSHGSTKHPEEQIMDAIAGRVAFFRPILVPRLPIEFSFEAIDTLRADLCPTASAQAMLRAVADAWPVGTLFIRAERAHKKAAQVPAEQQSLILLPVLDGDLRAISVTRNSAARASGLNIHRNMRVPEGSVIASVFRDGGCGTAVEDLSSWSSSNGTQLSQRQVSVGARRSGDGVDVLVIDAS